MLGMGKLMGVSMLNMVVRECPSTQMRFKQRFERCEGNGDVWRNSVTGRKMDSAKLLRQECAWCVLGITRTPASQNEGWRGNGGQVV